MPNTQQMLTITEVACYALRELSNAVAFHPETSDPLTLGPLLTDTADIPDPAILTAAIDVTEYHRLFRPPTIWQRWFPTRRAQQLAYFLDGVVPDAVWRLSSTLRLRLKDGDRFIALPITHMRGAVYEIRDPMHRVALRVNVDGDQLYIAVAVVNGGTHAKPL